MNVSGIANQNFGRFVDYSVWDNVNLNEEQINIINNCKYYINKTEGKSIDTWAKVGKPNIEQPDKLYVKFKTIPLYQDMISIRMQRSSANKDDYKRHSKWFPLDESLLYNALMYLNKQNAFIHHCVKDPNHTATAKEGYGIPKF